MTPSSKRSFRALMVAQFFGAFNDNFYKLTVSFLVVSWVDSPALRNQLTTMGTFIFAAPFILFSFFAGRLADRWSKRRVVVVTKAWELLVVAAGALSLWMESLPMLLGVLFLLAMQAAFFGPAKYGVLPEIVPEEGLSGANAWLNIGTMAAILIGTVAGGQFAERPHVAMACMAAAAVVGLVSSLFMQPLVPRNPQLPLSINWLGDLKGYWQAVSRDRALKLSIIAVNWFWLMGAALQTNLILYTRTVLGVSEQFTSVLILMVLAGVGLGSWVAGRGSHGHVELGFVPLGALGMSMFSMALWLAEHSIVQAGAALFFFGFFGGLYDVPLMALIQWRAPDAERGRVIALANFLSFVAIAIGSALLWIMGTAMGLDPAQAFLGLGLISFCGTLVLFTSLPSAPLRLVLYGLTNIFYRLRVIGRDHIPVRGPALLVSNHLSLADGFLVGGSIARLPRFLIWRPYYEARPWHWLLKIMGAIPISDKDSPKEIVRSLQTARQALEDGHLVCIFAEGQVSRTGNLLEFKKGFEVIIKGLDVPVIPVHLDRVWGSIFSFEGGKVLFKWPRRIPYPVTVTFGSPVPHDAVTPLRASTVRQAVLDLGSQAFQHRLEERKALPIEFLKRARRQPAALAVADSSGLKMSFGRLAAVSTVFADSMNLPLPSRERVGVRVGDCVGILLPPSVPGVVANLAVSLAGKIPVNLNYTAGSESVQLAIEKAQITRVLTSRKVLEKTGLQLNVEFLYVEDLLPRLPKSRILWHEARLRWLPFWRPSPLPSPILRTGEGVKIQPPRPPSAGEGRGEGTALHQTATILFSSGSTGIPKGVVLSHANVLSNILGLAQVFDLGRRDAMIGVLPFFHSFGFTGTLWFPLLHGFSAIYHNNPLDAKTVGELSARYSATLILATPTFLSAYVRKCSSEQFRFLRFIITGAERLRESIAEAVTEKFKCVPLEGYGCTELSPVACVSVPDVSMDDIRQTGRKAGKVGHPLPGVTVKIVDPDTQEVRPQGESGLLLIKGPNVMQGYLGEPEKTAEVIRDGWYVTGDIAAIDNDGFVMLVDRLSRFSKIGGEMVPHVRIEEELQQLSNAEETRFVVTAVPDDKRGERLIVFYLRTSEPTLEDTYTRLKASDLPKLWIPDRCDFHPLEAIPLLGTGKLDLTQLKKLAQEMGA